MLEIYKNILSEFHNAGYPSAVIAGGAMRDLTFGRAIKDIDVFISYEDDKRVSQFDVDNRSYIYKEFSGYMNIPDVGRIYSVEQQNNNVNDINYNIEVISMDKGMSPFDRIDTFDFGICQIAFNGSEIYKTEHFKHDEQNKTVTLVYCENQHEWDRSTYRYERSLSKKYSEFTAVIPPRDSYPELHTNKNLSMGSYEDSMTDVRVYKDIRR